MVSHVKKSILAIILLLFLAIPATAQSFEKPRPFSLAEILELALEHMQSLAAAFGPGLEPHGKPGDDAPAATLEDGDGLPNIGPELEPYGLTTNGAPGAATENGDGLPNIGPELEPHGLTTNSAAGAATEEGGGLPNFGPGLEPYG